MRVFRRPLAPGELDHELVGLTVSAGSALIVGLWLAAGLPWPHCAFHDFTGHPCLTCGATRATLAIFHGHFFRAFGLNPLVVVGLVSVAFYDAYAAGVLVLRLPRIRLTQLNGSAKRFLRVAAVLIACANWIYLLARGIV